jgi:DNA-binding NarL/FixJ family response regulator
METSDGAKFASAMKRLVIVADNSLIVEAVRLGLRKSGEFNLVGHADPRRTAAATIVSVHPDVALVDDLGRSERVVELVRELKVEDQHLSIVVLSVEMDQDWLEHVFDAGATGVISKATHPVALVTLLRETLNGHIFHKFASSGTVKRDAEPIATSDLPLTTREVEILQLVAAGSTNSEVAQKLWVTEQTVKFHLRNIYRKLDVANRTEASHFAHVNGLVKPNRTLSAVS